VEIVGVDEVFGDVIVGFEPRDRLLQNQFYKGRA
jgi:hypothetical protein